MTTTITAVESAQSNASPGEEVSIAVTNGSAKVGLGISDQLAAMSTGRGQRTSVAVTLDPEDAIELAIALLCAAGNARAGLWGAPTDDREHAREVLH